MCCARSLSCRICSQRRESAGTSAAESRVHQGGLVDVLCKIAVVLQHSQSIARKCRHSGGSREVCTSVWPGRRQMVGWLIIDHERPPQPVTSTVLHAACCKMHHCTRLRPCLFKAALFKSHPWPSPSRFVYAPGLAMPLRWETRTQARIPRCEKGAGFCYRTCWNTSSTSSRMLAVKLFSSAITGRRSNAFMDATSCMHQHG